MIKSYNINIESTSPLSSPAELKAMYPADEALMAKVMEGRSAIQAVLDRKSRKHILIAGPCSIHNEDAALEYAEKLLRLQEKVSSTMILVMRAYFEKPRTTVGWKGLIYDPDLDESYNIEKGLRLARKILREIIRMGLPTATEILEPIIPQFIADLVSWAAIGARTTESQTHRQMTSGLSMPTGFKNSTDGSILNAVNAIKSARTRHSFIGITEDGKASLFRTRGNPYGHLVLRGGDKSPNYEPEHIAFARIVMERAGLPPNIIIDCSHANSAKQPERQLDVLREVVRQSCEGERAIVGSMLESNLSHGSQSIKASVLDPGISITDACIGWDQTEEVILESHERLNCSMSA